MKKIASPLFQDLSEAELDTLAAAGHLRTRQFAKHEVIFHAGSCVREIGIVLRGSVHIENLDLWGTKSILSSVGAGQAFAETYATAKNASYNAAADQVEEGTVQVTFDADAAQSQPAQLGNKIVLDLVRGFGKSPLQPVKLFFGISNVQPNVDNGIRKHTHFIFPLKKPPREKLEG